MTIDYPETIDIQDTNDEIWFDIINRTITPKNEQTSEDILVQNDANSRNFGFMIQRYFENEDLSTKRIRIHYVNSLNQHDIASAHSIEVIGDTQDVISFKWLISDKVCAEGGNIQFAIEFYNDRETYRLFTKPTSVGITKGICTVGEFIEPESDWFKEYSSRMNILEAYIESFNKAVENGEFDGAYSLNTFANAVKGNANGEVVRIDDVSPVEHTMDVKVKSKNLIPYPYIDTSLERNGLTYTDNGDGSISVKGTVTEAYSAFDLTRSLQLDDGVTYCMGGADCLYFGYLDETGVIKYYHGNASFTWSKNYTPIRLYLQYKQGDVVDEVVRPMFIVGDVLPEYIPYVDPTTVTLTRCGKNLLTYPYADTTKENKGITFTDNKDGSITINGTATGEAYFNLQENVKYGEIMMNAITTQNAHNGVYVVNKRLFYNPINQKVSIVITQGTTVSNERVYPQLELGTVVTDWEQPKTQALYTPNADGTVSGVTSLSPTTTLLTDTENVVIECEYNKDTNKALSSLQTSDGTIVSQNADFAEVAEWADGNPEGEDRTGYFVCANVPLDGIVMKKATSIDDVKGVTIAKPAFAGNYTKDKLDSNGKLLPKYSYVAIIGFVPVIDNGTCTVGGRCMPDDNGCAIPSSNSMGYQVVNRIDENRVLIIIEPNGDMVQRIKTKINTMQEQINNLGGGGGGNNDTPLNITQVEFIPNATATDVGKVIQYIGEETQEMSFLCTTLNGFPDNVVPPIGTFVYNQGDFAVGAVAYSASSATVAEVTSETEGKYYIYTGLEYIEVNLPDEYNERITYYTINYETPNYYWKPIQSQLVSGENIKTINGESILGSGDLVIEGTGGGITEITEDTFVYNLDDGIYHIDGDTGATIYYDDNSGSGLQEGSLLVNYSTDYNSYTFIAIGRDLIWDIGTFVGEIQQVDDSWGLVHYGKAENNENKAYKVNDKTNNHSFYPSVKLMTEYVKEQLQNINGGSSGGTSGGTDTELREAVKASVGETTYDKVITNPDNVKVGAYSNTGSYNSSRTQGKCTEKIDVSVGEIYSVSGACNNFFTLLALYDVEGNFIKRVPEDTTQSVVYRTVEYTVEEGVSFIAFSTADTSKGEFIVTKEVTEFNNIPNLIDELEAKHNEDILKTEKKIDDDIIALDEKITLTVKNICPNSDFSDNSIWELGNTATSMTVENNVATLTNNGSGAQTRIRMPLSGIPQDHIIYVQASIKSSPNSLWESFNIYTDASFNFIHENPRLKNSVSLFNDYYGTFDFSQTSSTNAKLWITSTYQKGDTAKDQVTQIKNVFICDLTESFGVGKEPSASQFYNILQAGGKWFKDSKQIFMVDLIKPTLPIVSDYLITVGENGDCQTINEAIERASKAYPAYKKRGIKIEIRILDGTIIDEQILVESLDLSYISITTDNPDNKVVVTPTANNWDKNTVSHDSRGNMPFFAGEFGARLPMIKCLFSCTAPTLQIEDKTIGIVGYYCNRGSMGLIVVGSAYPENVVGSGTPDIEAEVGFEGFYDCIIANNNSEITLRECIARNAGRYGVMSRHISRISARSADLTGCQLASAYADRSSIMDVRFANVSDSLNGIQSYNTSNITAVETIANNVANLVAESREGSIINCDKMTIDNVKDVFKVVNGGTIVATNTAPTNVSGTTHSKTVNTLDVNGVIYA